MSVLSEILNHHQNQMTAGQALAGKSATAQGQCGGCAASGSSSTDSSTSDFGHHLSQRLSHPAGDRDAEPGSDRGHRSQRVHQPVGAGEQPGAVDLNQSDAEHGSEQPVCRCKRSHGQQPGQRRNGECGRHERNCRNHTSACGRTPWKGLGRSPVRCVRCSHGRCHSVTRYRDQVRSRQSRHTGSQPRCESRGAVAERAVLS